MVRHFLSMLDYEADELLALIFRAQELKQLHKNGTIYEPLKQKVLGMIFEKSSTRTRVSFEAGIIQLGGQAIFLTPADTQLGRGEPISDTARVLSSMIDVIMIRTFSQSRLDEFAAFSKVPVINGLSDKLHPCQIMADLQTFYENNGSIKNKTFAWIGDGNNVCNSYIEACIKLDFNLNIACPQGYEPDETLVKLAGSKVNLTRNITEAVKGASLITTDVFTSMGQEAQTQKRLNDFRDFQVNEKLMDEASDDAIFLHCLPAHRGEEISENMLDDSRSRVWQQAENRLHIQKAILEFLIEKHSTKL